MALPDCLNHNRLPMPIADMGPWHFWARPDAVGLSLEDAAAIRDGSASEAQQMRALEHAKVAMDALVKAQGPQHGDVVATPRPS